MALYKQGSRCLLQIIFLLPSKSTIKKCLVQIPLETGINRKNSLKNKKCLAFEKLSLGFKYDKYNDKVTGYVDLGSLGRRNEIANHALVFL